MTDSTSSYDQTKTYAYDSLHRLTSETDNQAPGVFATTSYTYGNGNGDLTETQQVDANSNVLSDTKDSYDGQGRLTTEQLDLWHLDKRRGGRDRLRELLRQWKARHYDLCRGPALTRGQSP